MARIPITPAVLEWAIEQAGLDPAGFAEAARFDVDTVLEWLSADAQPTKTQLNKIATVLKRPTAFFLLPDPPRDVAVPAAFRRPAGRSQHKATKTEIEAVARARRIQRIAKWTAERVGDSRWVENPIPEASTGQAPQQAATAAASWLDWSIAEQRAAPSPSAVVKLMRARLEERGVIALQLSIGKDGCRGFSLYDRLKPVVTVNTHYNPQARLFTYIHEVGHLMRRTDAMCVDYSQTAAERWCERFAASFLLPRQPLRERVDERFGRDAVVSELDEVRKLANDFNVSLAATAIRLDDLGWGRDLFLRVPKTADDKQRGGPGNTDTTRGAARTRELGEGYFSLLLAGQDRGVLGRQDVLRYLDVSERQLQGTGIGPLER